MTEINYILIRDLRISKQRRGKHWIVLRFTVEGIQGLGAPYCLRPLTSNVR
jgi:hypothetical protein